MKSESRYLESLFEGRVHACHLIILCHFEVNIRNWTHDKGAYSKQVNDCLNQAITLAISYNFPIKFISRVCSSSTLPVVGTRETISSSRPASISSVNCAEMLSRFQILPNYLQEHQVLPGLMLTEIQP